MHLNFVHKICKEHLKRGDLAVDATLGNGHDTLMLLMAGADVVGCDIQPAALESTRKRIGKKIELHLACHSKIGEILGERQPKLALFNLGYLPGSGNKEQTTMCETTLIAVQSLADRLLPGGILLITCYPGHPEGAKEEVLLLEWAASIPKDQWITSHHRWRLGTPSPSLLLIQKQYCS